MRIVMGLTQRGKSGKEGVFVYFRFSFVKEGCWPNDPGEGLRRYFDFNFGEGRRICFVRESWV